MHYSEKVIVPDPVRMTTDLTISKELSIVPDLELEALEVVQISQEKQHICLPPDRFSKID